MPIRRNVEKLMKNTFMQTIVVNTRLAKKTAFHIFRQSKDLRTFWKRIFTYSLDALQIPLVLDKVSMKGVNGIKIRMERRKK